MKSPGERPLLRLVVVTGVASVATQLLLIREYLAQFQGNEFVISLILFCWLALGAVGTRLAGAFHGGSGRFAATQTRLGFLSLALAALPVAVIASVRLLRDPVFLHGRSVGFYETLGFLSATLGAYALLVGFALPFSLSVLQRRDPAFPVRRLYVADAVGDAVGGALFSFVLVHWATPMQAAGLTGSLLASAAVAILFSAGARPRLGVLGAAGLCAAVLAAGVVLERRTLAPEGASLVEYRETRYGRITVLRDREQVTVFQDGRPAFSGGDTATAEEAIHFPMSQLARPERVLMVSAGPGMLSELAKYPLRSVDYVELNPDVAEIQFRYGLLRPIAGLQVRHVDGRAFLAGTDRRYDAVIVCLPEPDTFQTNRFFTDGFFRLVRQRLTGDGVLAFSVEGFENYLGEVQRRKVSSLANTVDLLFSHRLLLPGQRIHFLCAQRPLDADVAGLLERRDIPTRHIEGYFRGNVTPERTAELAALVDGSVPVNADLSPHLVRILFRQWFVKFSDSPLLFGWAVAVLTGLYLLRIRRASFVLFSTGFATMGSEILVIFAFQIFFGYVYLQIGLIVTVFLAGLIPGAMIAGRTGIPPRPALLVSDGLLALLAGLFAALISGGAAPPPQWAFWGFSLAVSLLCGFQFPLAVSLAGGGRQAAGAAFSADLMGAALGILATSTVLVPVVGIFWTAAGLGFLKIVSMGLVGFHGADRQA